MPLYRFYKKKTTKNVAMCFSQSVYLLSALLVLNMVIAHSFKLKFKELQMVCQHVILKCALLFQVFSQPCFVPSIWSG